MMILLLPTPTNDYPFESLKNHNWVFFVTKKLYWQVQFLRRDEVCFFEGYLAACVDCQIDNFFIMVSDKRFAGMRVSA